MTVQRDGFPDEYYARARRFRSGWRRALGVLAALTALDALLIAGFARGLLGGAVAVVWPWAGAVFSAVLAFGWFILGMSYLDDLRVKPRIVPYFPASVPGPDTFTTGYALARHSKLLDEWAREAGVAALTAFGFTDDLAGDEVTWHPAAEGVRTVEALLRRCHEDPGALAEPQAVVSDLEPVLDVLREADRRGIGFCLHLRADAAYTAHEFDIRKGRYWAKREEGGPRPETAGVR
jgi:hypothetical protein